MPEPPGRTPPSRRALATALLALFAAAGMLAAAAAYDLFLAPAGSAPAPVSVRIEAGSNLTEIARALAGAGAVTSPRAFAVAARLAGLERRLQPGDYRLDPALSLPALVRSLVEGRGRSATVTIPEGWRLEQIAARLETAGVCDRRAFLAQAREPALLAALAIPGPSAEGFLFPETYSFAVPSEPREVIGAMHRQFVRVWGELTLGAPTPALTQLQAVTLASIVERETASPAERPLVAAVFLNRLRLGMPLQADPTVIYGIDGFDGNLRRRDLAAANPYNTYHVRGLPPGPIAAPGRASLAAVLNPARADYLYFVGRNDGTHQFSRTLVEHNRAVQRFQLAGRRGQG